MDSRMKTYTRRDFVLYRAVIEFKRPLADGEKVVNDYVDTVDMDEAMTWAAWNARGRK